MAAVSTSATYQGAVMLGKMKMPLIHWHGTNDKTEPNTYAAGYKACITWYQNTGGGSPTWIPLQGVGHGGDVHAYAGNTLRDWIDNLFPPIVIPPTPEPLDSVLFSYGKGDSIYFKLKSGRVIKK
jgi:hypothetical protein